MAQKSMHFSLSAFSNNFIIGTYKVFVNVLCLDICDFLNKLSKEQILLKNLKIMSKLNEKTTELKLLFLLENISAHNAISTFLFCLIQSFICNGDNCFYRRELQCNIGVISCNTEARGYRGI